MPTVSPSTHEDPHRDRRRAESFGVDPRRYDRARPRYPAALVEKIIATSPGRDVLDVGCGTGIAARLFQRAGCRVLGVDVDARMADFARGRGLEVEVAAFETWEPASRDFDVVIAAQAWHWIDPVAGAAKAAGVLRPAGRLALFWNFSQASADLAEAFADVFRRVAPDSLSARHHQPGTGPAGYSNLTDRAADAIRTVGDFTEPERWQFEWDRSQTKQQWLDGMLTGADASQLPPDQLQQVLAGVGAAIDAAGGTVNDHLTTVVTTATRLPH